MRLLQEDVYLLINAITLGDCGQGVVLSDVVKLGVPVMDRPP